MLYNPIVKRGTRIGDSISDEKNTFAVCDLVQIIFYGVMILIALSILLLNILGYMNQHNIAEDVQRMTTQLERLDKLVEYTSKISENAMQ